MRDIFSLSVPAAGCRGTSRGGATTSAATATATTSATTSAATATSVVTLGLLISLLKLGEKLPVAVLLLLVVNHHAGSLRTGANTHHSLEWNSLSILRSLLRRGLLVCRADGAGCLGTIIGPVIGKAGSTASSESCSATATKACSASTTRTSRIRAAESSRTGGSNRSCSQRSNRFNRMTYRCLLSMLIDL